MNTAQRVATMLIALTTAASAANGPDIAALKPLHLTTTLAGAAIVAGPAHRDAAAGLARRIAEGTGLRLPVISDLVAAGDMAGHGNLIALGQFADNALLERLYYRWYVVVDGSQPGAGGWLLQTVHNPEGVGVNVVVVGASDAAGVAGASDRLIEAIARHGRTLPRLFEVELGRGGQLVRDYGETVIDPARQWPTIHPMEVHKALGEAAMLYLYTADARYLLAYKEHLIRWLDTWLRNDPYQQGATDELWRIFITWDMVEEAPRLTDAERLHVTRQLWTMLLRERTPYPNNYNLNGWRAFMKEGGLSDSHRGRFGSTMYFGGRYFRDYYDRREADAWFDEIRRFWSAQMHTPATRFGLDNSIVWSMWMRALEYALCEDEQAFLSEDVLGYAATYTAAQNMNGIYLGGGWHPAPIWALAAHRFDQPHLLWPVRQHHEDMRLLRMPWLVNGQRPGFPELGRSYWDGRPAQPPGADGDWVIPVRRHPDEYDLTRTFGPRTVPADEAFNFVVFSDPAGGGGQYLCLRGHNAGTLSRDAANAISEFGAAGRYWLTSGGGGVNTIRTHTSVSIARDGGGEILPAYAALERAEAHDAFGIAASVLPGYNGADWRRTILNVPSRWFVIVDEVTALEPGAFVLESRWRSYSQSGFMGDDFVNLQPGPGGSRYEMRLAGSGWQTQYIIPTRYSSYLATPVHPFPARNEQIDAHSTGSAYNVMLARRWSGTLDKGERHHFVHLLEVHPHDEAPPYRLLRMGADRFRVDGDDGCWSIDRDGGGRWRVGPADAGARAVADIGPQAVASGVPEMRSRWERAGTQRILSSTWLSAPGGGGFAVGRARGGIEILDADGHAVGQAAHEGNVFALTAVDLDGDGSDELIAGSDTGGVIALSARGEPAWRWTPPPWKPNHSWRQSFGEHRATITRLEPIDVEGDGRMEILAAGIYFYVLSGDGKMIAMYDEPRELSITDLVGVKAMGLWRTRETELIVAAGRDAGGRGLIFGDVADPGIYGVRLWSAANGDRLRHMGLSNRHSYGHAHICALAGDFVPGGGDEFVLGADAFHNQLNLYSASDGRLWSHDLGASVEALARADVNGDGTADIIAGTQLGQVQAFTGDGSRLFIADVGAHVMSLASVEAADGAATPLIFAGTMAGRVVAIDATGRVIAAAEPGGLIDHLTVARQSVLASSADGWMGCFSLPRSASLE